MFEFLEAWIKLWYPDNWLVEPSSIMPFFIVGSIVGFLSLLTLCLRWGKYGLIDVVVLFVFLWALPLLVSLVVLIIMVVLGIIMFVLLGWAILNLDLDSSTPEYTAKKTGKNTWEIHKYHD